MELLFLGRKESLLRAIRIFRCFHSFIPNTQRWSLGWSKLAAEICG